MPQIWDDVNNAPTNVTLANNQNTLRFRWHFITFSGEAPVEVVVRWKKASSYPNGTVLSLRDRIRKDEAQWSGWSSFSTTVYRLEDRTTWVLSGGQLVPPAEASRRYSYTHHVDFPINKFSEGYYIFQVSILSYTDNTGAVIVVADPGWTTHRLEINDFDDQQTYPGSAQAAVKGPGFDNEGVYGVKVEVMSEAGITAESAEVQFNVWNTNKFLKKDDGTVPAVPELIHTGTQPARVIRSG